MVDKIFLDHSSIKIINDDVLETNTVESNSVNLIVTSPPYNVDIKYNSHNDQISYEEYLQFSKKWLSRCFEWLKDGVQLCSLSIITT